MSSGSRNRVRHDCTTITKKMSHSDMTVFVMVILNHKWAVMLPRSLLSHVS